MLKYINIDCFYNWLHFFTWVFQSFLSTVRKKCSWRFLRYNELEQLEKLEKELGFRNLQQKKLGNTKYQEMILIRHICRVPHISALSFLTLSWSLKSFTFKKNLFPKMFKKKVLQGPTCFALSFVTFFQRFDSF